MSDLIGICTKILDDAGFDLIPVDGAKCGKVKDLWIAQNNLRYSGRVGNLPEFTTGCPDCDRMPFGQLCERCDYDMTVTSVSYRCQ